MHVKCSQFKNEKRIVTSIFSNLYTAAKKLILLLGHTKKKGKCGKSASPRKSLQSIDVQYLEMINHPDHRPQGVRRCILEPSSNRLAEQCGVGHLAQTTVHLLLHGERLPDLIPHTLDILYIANNLHLNKSHIPSPTVWQSYWLVIFSLFQCTQKAISYKSQYK